ncbi:YicC/YloC family endoribonuclease [Staphylospora marina]|uniref:YicC/YloC family endoribonuclease n=1 Tax=Staphylospora marina TaxID=2490858 RepID=UPI0013DDB11A|nr:YicC/YloC family endoribonuclease [Staphylospora marina]
MKSENAVFSMTGFGRGEAEHEGIRVAAEIRSVNHRFLEIQVRLPHGFLSLEEAVRKEVQSAVRRGRVDVFITVEAASLPERSVQIDWELVRKLIEAGRELEKKMDIRFDLTVSDLMARPECWIIGEPDPDVGKCLPQVISAVREAVGRLREMRLAEGARLRDELLERLRSLREVEASIRREAAFVPERMAGRIRARMEEWLKEADIPEERLLAEAAIWAEKADITEELTRLDSHLRQFGEALDSAEPVGRRLDFLIQEMNREINTIGSKAGVASISERVIEAKSILEKMKEQVQNIE